MEKILKYSAISSLKDIALKNVTTILWSQPEILASLEKVGIEIEVENNMRKLNIPAQLIEQMKYLLKPIGTEMLIWKKFHEEFVKSDNIEMLCFVKHLCWAHSVGVIDYRKTAENMIRHEMFGTTKLYILASAYYLEEYIPDLFQKLSAKSKQYFLKKKPIPCTIPRLWPCIFTAEQINVRNLFFNIREETVPNSEFMCQFSAYIGDKEGTENCFQKLPSEVKEDLLVKLILEILNFPFPLQYVHRYKFPKEKLSDNLIYLLSLVKPDQQIKILQSNPRRILQYFLDWPWHNRFLDMVGFAWNFLNAKDYVFLLNQIADKMKSGYCFAEIFKDFFLRGSREFMKEFVYNERRSARILNTLFRVRLPETVKLIFRKLDSKYRKTLIYSRGMFDFFNNFFLKRQLDPILLCLQESALSVAEKEELKKTFFSYLNETVVIPDSSKQKIRKLFLKCLFGNQLSLPKKRKRKSEDSRREDALRIALECKLASLKQELLDLNREMSRKKKRSNRLKHGHLIAT